MNCRSQIGGHRPGSILLAGLIAITTLFSPRLLCQTTSTGALAGVSLEVGAGVSLAAVVAVLAGVLVEVGGAVSVAVALTLALALALAIGVGDAVALPV